MFLELEPTSRHSCDPKEVALKGFFLGPQAENAEWAHALVNDLFSKWFHWRRELFPEDGRAISEKDLASPLFGERRERFRELLGELMTRFEREVPKHSPRYAGHMFSEISLPALLGHVATLLHNPNNISGESSLVGVELEEEAVAELRRMVGYDLIAGAGHFTSGGTIANFEALVRARSRLAQWLALGAALRMRAGQGHRLFESAHLGWDAYDREAGRIPESERRPFDWVSTNPWSVGRALRQVYGSSFEGPVLLVPENKHYSWKKGIQLLGLGEDSFWGIALDRWGHLDPAHLESLLERAARENRPVLSVVSVAGTTEMGSVDPIHEVQAVLDRWRIERGIHLWHHVDAAYGGFLCAVDPKHLRPAAAQALAAIRAADSVTLDPHKLGYVPYSSGAFLARTRRDYVTRTFDSPYLRLDPARDKGLFTLEGSRSAAGAVATWMTAKTIGLGAEGYGLILARTIRNRVRLEEQLRGSALPVRIAPGADSNLLCLAFAEAGERLSVTNARTRKISQAFAPGQEGPFILSETTLKRTTHARYIEGFCGEWQAEVDAEELNLVRICLMNPFFDSREMNRDFGADLVAALEDACSVSS